MKRAAAALLACFVAATAEASEVHELDGYTSRFFPLQRIELANPTGVANDKLIVPAGWVSGLTSRGNHWVGTGDDRYVVQIAASESDLEDDGAARRRELLDALRERYSRDVAVRQEGDSTFFEGTSDVPGGRHPALVRSLIRIWPAGDQLNMVQFHVIIAADEWGTPEAEDVISLFRAQLARVQATRPQDVAQGVAAQPSAAHGADTPVEDMGAEPDYDALAAPLGPLKTISLDAYRFRVPHSWDTGRDDQGVPWTAPPSRDYGLERRVRLLPAGRDWRETMRARAAEILRDLTGRDMRREVGGLDVERMLALQVPVTKSDRDGFSAWHWPQLVHIDGNIVEAWLSLYVRERLWHSKDTEILEELFGQQFRRAPPGDPRLVGSLEEGYGFDRLRPIRAFDFIELNVPARWYDEYSAPDGMWVAAEDEPNTGTLWIGYDLFDVMGGADEVALEALAQQVSPRGAKRLPTRQPGRLVFYLSETGREKQDKLRFHRWTLLETRGNDLVVVNISLVIGTDQESLPPFISLVQIMEREIDGITIGTFPAPRTNAGASSSR